MWARIRDLVTRIVRWCLRVAQGAAPWVRYAYFLRFSLMLWVFAPALCLLNSLSSTLTSGIVTPEKWQQYFCVGFFAVSASFAALVIARVVIINGPERWDHGYNPANDARPLLLTTLLDNDRGKCEFVAFFGSQLPTLFVFLYVTVNGVGQNVNPWHIWPGLLLGALLSACFWWLANAWYYLRYVATPSAPGLRRFSLGKNAARTMVFPRCCFHLNRVGSRYPGRPTIEQAETLLPRLTLWSFGRWVARQPGYGTVADTDHFFYEAHAFATIALVMFAQLAMMIWILTAPVPTPAKWRWIVIAYVVLVGVGAIAVFVSSRPMAGGRMRAIKWALSLGVVAFVGGVIALDCGSSVERFPIFATVLILVSALLYALGGIAFFFDRYRVPVLTLIVVAMIAPRVAHLDRTLYWGDGPPWKNGQGQQGLHKGNGQEEHYLSTTYTVDQRQIELQTPAEILRNKMRIDPGEPLIVVTATGGGLHASAWTAAILARLEQQLGLQFHRRLLLASSVSGGSVGLLSYLRELKEGTLENHREMALERMQAVAQCSSLEAVGWGLLYYDLPKAFVPVIPYLIRPSSGDNDLESSPLWKDRTWSLRKAFERNLENLYCKRLWAQDGHEATEFPDDPNPTEGLTLHGMSPAIAGNEWIPGFTMNTTTVERGERFLLANYRVPENQMNAEPEYRARSFLATFARSWPNGGVRPPEPDLPLATAAQMSATFPYVSSAARVPMAVDNNVASVHFVDGGYFDNDGTVSAIEFLRYALNPSIDEKRDHPDLDTMDRLGHGGPPLRVLMIEIRNSGDIAPTGEETAGDESDITSPGNALNQLGGPLLAFWQAGHESVTGRNRTALGLAEQALAEKLELHRVVFADANSLKVAGTDPLNWSLTPRQRAEVRSSAVALPFQDEEAKCWFTQWDRMWNNAHQPKPRAAGICDCFAPESDATAKAVTH